MEGIQANSSTCENPPPPAPRAHTHTAPTSVSPDVSDAHPVGDARRGATHEHQERGAEEREEERDGDEGKCQRAKPFSGTNHQQGEDQGDAGDGYQ